MRIEKACAEETSLFLFLRKRMGLSTGLIKRLKWKHALLVNGTPQFVDFRLKSGDVVCAVVEETSEGFLPEEIPISVLYEDDCFIAIDKPAGVMVHPSFRKNEGTLANGLLSYYNKTNQLCGIHPVSRLDRDTFGVVIFAKNAHIHALFCNLHKKGKIEKNYEAAVFGCPEKDCGAIELPVYKIGGGSLLRTVDVRGQYAKSEFCVLEKEKNCTKLLLHPITGRTHQLRLHTLAFGFPILGDPQYCTPASKAYSDAHGLFSQQLCAVSYAFEHPITAKKVRISSKQAIFLPKD